MPKISVSCVLFTVKRHEHENALKSNRLLSFTYDGTYGVIKATVERSMKKGSYTGNSASCLLRQQVAWRLKICFELRYNCVRLSTKQCARRAALVPFLAGNCHSSSSSLKITPADTVSYILPQNEVENPTTSFLLQMHPP